jgi:hypothetical protein
MCYVIKKNNLHSKRFLIEPNNNISNIVDEMIENYNNFEHYKKNED